MPSSSLDPDNLSAGQRSRRSPPGHDTKSLGPSDSSDSGSDMAGPGLIDDEQIGLERGTHEDSEAGRLDSADAGASIGDQAMDDNSDRYGTGERSAAGKEPSVESNRDYGVDRIVDAEEAGLGGGLDQAEEARLGVTDDDVDSDVDPRR